MKRLSEGFQALFILSFLLLQASSYGQSVVKPKLNWSMQKPLEQKVFIENNGGQFDSQAINDERIYYKTILQGVDIYFTDKGILYRHDEKVKDHSEKEERKTDPDTIPFKTIRHTAEFQWKGGSATRFTAEDEVGFYYTYYMGAKHTVVAHAFKKILCPNIYPGIDIAYSFPDGENSLACTINVHPGADSSNIKLIEDGMSSAPFNKTASISVKNDVGDFTLAKHTAATTSLWISNPGFTGYDGLYDLCYDDSGNVYVYGGVGPYQLAKINSSGNLKWIYNANWVKDSIADYLFGAFVTDKTTGTSFVAEGTNDSIIGPEIIKVNTSGMVTGTVNIGDAMSETWRMDMNYCTHQLVIGGGGVSSLAQAAVIDTSLIGLLESNVLGAKEGKNDVGLLTCDKKAAYCYMAFTWPNEGPAFYGNVLLQCPVPGLWPPNYTIYDGYNFTEIRSNSYVDVRPGIQGLEVSANGMNGIVSTDSDLYMWDGYTITAVKKNNGDIIKTLNMNPVVTGFVGQEEVTCSGIDADYCDNIYLGDQANIDVLDTSFNRISVIPMPSTGDTVYDVHISPQGNLYACGYGFVTSYFMPQSAISINKSTSPACSGCHGTAHVSLSGCVAGDFSWSNGAIGEFAGNLCAGTYTVSARLDCGTVISDTITIQPSPKPSVTIPGADVKEVSCFDEHNGSAVALSSGGTPPYTYMWYPSNFPNDSIRNLSPGTYTFMVTDINGCASIDTVTISQPALLNVSATVNGTILPGENAALTASVTGGTPPYTYSWSDGASAGTINVSPDNTTTYTVTVTDNNGCVSTAEVTVDVLCGAVFIPTAFSPSNPSNYNQYLYVRGDCITEMDFLVFDRWGNKVFESNNLSKGWDGNYNGIAMNPGSFVWYLKATLKDGTKVERNGNVTLVR